VPGSRSLREASAVPSVGGGIQAFFGRAFLKSQTKSRKPLASCCL